MQGMGWGDERTRDTRQGTGGCCVQVGGEGEGEEEAEEEEGARVLRVRTKGGTRAPALHNQTEPQFQNPTNQNTHNPTAPQFQNAALPLNP